MYLQNYTALQLRQPLHSVVVYFVLTILLHSLAPETFVLGRLLYKEEVSEFTNNCHQRAAKLKYASVNVLFCGIEAEDSALKSVIGRIPLNINSRMVNLVKKVKYSFKTQLDFLIFTDSRRGDHTEACLSDAVPLWALNPTTRLIVCDKSLDIPDKFKNKTVVKLLGLANAIYLTRSKCWRMAPYYILHRYFSEFPCGGPLLERIIPNGSLIDMKGQTIQVVTFKRSLFVVINQQETDQKRRYDGVEVQIFFEFTRLLNLTWKSTEITRKGIKWGRFVDKKIEGGALGALTSGEADIALIGAWFDHNLNKYVDLSLPWTYNELVLLVPRPIALGYSWKNIFRPYQELVWIAILTSAVGFPLVAWTLETIYSKYFVGSGKPYPLSSYFLYTVGFITASSTFLITRKAPRFLRVVLLTWITTYMLLFVGYNSNIASLLTTPTYSPIVDSVQKLVEENFTWGLSYGNEDPLAIIDVEEEWQRQLLRNYVTYNVSKKRELILGRKFAILTETLGYGKTVMVIPPLDDDVVATLRIMREALKHLGSATVIRKNTPLRTYYDMVIRRLSQSGLLSVIMKKMVRKYQKLSFGSLYQEPPPGFIYTAIPLTVENLRSVFFFLTVGLIVSSICFVLELFTKKMFD